MNRDYSRQAAAVGTQRIKERDYWLRQLNGQLIKSVFQYDHKNRESGKRHFDTVTFGFTPDLNEKLMKLGNQSHHRLHMILTAGVVVLLNKYLVEGNRDILIGAPIYKQEIQGEFINTALVLRHRLGNNTTFKKLLLQVRQTITEATTNQNYPLETLLYKLDILKDPAGDNDDFPLFDVAVLLENIHDKTYLGHLRFNIGFIFSDTGQGIAGVLEFNTGRYKKTTVRQIGEYYVHVLEQCLADIDTDLEHIELLTEKQRHRLLVEFNGSPCPFPGDKTLGVVFAEQVQQTPDRVALVGPQLHPSPLLGVLSVTYRELNKRSNRLAHLLRAQGVRPDSVVPLMAERSVEMPVSILAVLKAGGAYFPLDPLLPGNRVASMLADSGSGGVALLLSESRGAIPHDRLTLDLRDESLSRQPEENPEPVNRPTDLAYIISTSGSTGKPKGVMIAHSNVNNLVTGLRERIYREYTRPLNVALAAPFVFDASVKQIFAALLQGHCLCIVPEQTRGDADELPKFYRTYQIDISDGTPNLIYLLLESAHGKGTPGEVGVKHFLIGGEVLPRQRVEDFFKAFGNSGGNGPLITNVYGPSECSVDATSYEVTPGNLHRCDSIPIGKPLPNVKLYILDPEGRLCPPGVWGELGIGGQGVGRGYMNKPELTFERFINYRLPISYQNTPKAPSLSRNSITLYKTGDLCRWLPEGNIEFLGRLDHQVKIRGYRIELGEIENRLKTHEKVKEAVVIDRRYPSGDKYLCAYIVKKRTEEDIHEWGLNRYLAEELPDYMLPSYFVEIEKIPLNPNGKLDRKLLPEPENRAEPSGNEAPGNPVEKELAELWREILEIQSIGIDDNFFRRGGHSLKVVVLISRMHKAFHVKVPLTEIFKTPTIRGLASYIQAREKERFAPILPTEEKDYYELSSAQKRLYILNQMEKNSTGYNMPVVVELAGETDRDKVKELFVKLVNRHESFRTSLGTIAGTPVQRVHRQVDFEPEGYDRHAGLRLPGKAIIKNFIRPFDLSRAPLLRVGLIKEDEKEFLLIVDMHHIIGDGISSTILLNELLRLAAGQSLSPLRLQYKNYAQWQNSRHQQDLLLRQQNYWKEQFAGEIPLLDLPLDYVRPPLQSFEGRTAQGEIDEQQVGVLKSLALEQNATLFMSLLAVYYIFLAKLSNQEDIVVGTPTAGRHHADLGQIVGMFVNTLALRNYPVGDKTYKEFLSEIKERSLEAFENQDYQYENLLHQLSVTRNTSRNPLFDTMLVLQNIGLQIPGTASGGLELRSYEYDHETSQFDLSLIGVEVEEKLSLMFEYSTKLFKAVTIERFITYLKNIVAVIVKHPGIKISGIEIITAEEKHRILYDFNGPDVEFPRDRTIHRLFEEVVEKNPDRTAAVYMDRQLTYRELNRGSNRLARHLRKKGVAPDRVVAIMADRSLEMILGVLAVFKAGGAYLPVIPSYPVSRIEYMIENSGATLLLLADDFACQRQIRFHGELIDIQRSGALEKEDSNLEPLGEPGNLAYIIYTSGSTGRPKGVMVQYDSYSNGAFAWRQAYRLEEMEVNLLQVAAFSFDVFAEDLVRALLNGGKLVICPQEVKLDLELLHRFILTRNISCVDSTPSLLFPLMDYVYEHRLELGCLRLLILGADTCALEEFNKLVSRFGEKLRIINSYGVTESTIDTSVYEALAADMPLTGTVPIGKPFPNMKIHILNAQKTYQPVGVPGELYIGGKGVSRGYVNNPELTSERFLPDPFTRGKKMYRTGDSARWLLKGNVEFLGRLDQQVKIRGFRIELGEIENHLLKYPGIKEAVVLRREDNNGNAFLCGYVVGVEPATSIDPPALKGYLSGILPDYMVPAYVVQLEQIPLTPNGKVDRQSLSTLRITINQESTLPLKEVEKKLANIWSRVLGFDAADSPPGLDDNFFHLGGHSLNAMVLIAEIHQEFKVRVPLVEIFKSSTLRKLAGYLQGREAEKYASIKPVEAKEYYPLSSAQRRLYFLQQMDRGGTAYNIPAVFILEGILDKDRLKQTIRTLIRRHESLRTAVAVIAEEPVQRILREVDFEIPVDDAVQAEGEVKVDGIIRDFVRPFDLSRAPLLRIGLIRKEDTGHILMIDMHHIIADGVSTEILVKDFSVFYTGEKIPGMKLQYQDYTQWQNQEKVGETLVNQGKYWKTQFEEDIPILELPTDYARPLVQDFSGSSRRFEIGEESTGALNALAQETGATLFIVMLSLYTVFLAKLTARDDIAVGTAVAGRGHTDLKKIIGMFINTLVMRNYPLGEKPFSHFLLEVKAKTLEALENQDYPYDDLVEQVVVTRDLSRNPLFDTMLMLQNTDNQTLEIPGLRVVASEFSKKTSKFDLTLIAVESGAKLELTLEYSTALFKPGTIERFITYFNNVVQEVLENKHRQISQIEITGEEEKHRILYAFNNTAVVYPTDKTLQQLFAEQVERTPDRIALGGRYLGAEPTGPRIQLTYRELNKKSLHLAHFLRKKGVQPEVTVGLRVKRSVEMIVGLWGILKAGGAYLPIDPGYPPERIDFMLKDSGAGILLNENLLSQGTRFPQFTPFTTVTPSHRLAYVIYTSGSSGQPKGVMIENRPVVNFIKGITEIIPVRESDRILSLTTVSFDIFGLETILPLTRGSKVIIGTEEEQLFPDLAARVLEKEEITLFQATPSRLQLFLQDSKATAGLERLNYLLVGGEVFPEVLLEKLQKYSKARIYNVYGPTETTIWSTLKEVGGTFSLNIGKPLANTRIYLLDQYRKVVPTGVVGEIYIGGDGTARGYLNNPQLTAEKFCLRRPGGDLFKKTAPPGPPDKNFLLDQSLVTDQYLPAGHLFLRAKSQEPGAILYKTGDLARWLQDGNIECLGRSDSQVKIRGFRIEPEEIENLLLQHEQVTEAVVAARRDGSGDQALCAYIASDTKIDLPAIREYLSKKVPDYMIPSYFVPMTKIPLTPAGKIDRKALPEPGINPDAKGTYTAPRNELERKLVEIWSEVLHLDKKVVGIDANFFQSGGHSLKAIKLAAKIHKGCEVKMPLELIFKTPTIRGLSHYLQASERYKYASVKPVEEMEYYRLSSAQKRLFILQEMNPDSTSYNLTQLLVLKNTIERNRLKETIHRLIRRHESFRTAFTMVNKEPVQRIHAKVDIEIEYHGLETGIRGRGHTSPASIIENFIAPFDLSRVPLLRLGLIKTGTQQHILIMDIHHIITDVVSNRLLLEEFQALYHGDELPPPKLQYKDYTGWQNHETTRESIKQQGQYWLEVFSDGVPLLHIPTDYPRPPEQSLEGGSIDFTIDAETTKTIKTIAAEKNATLFMVFLAILNILLAKFCKQEDIVVGTVVAGRDHIDLENTIGFFVNVIVLRNYPSGEKTFTAFLEEIKTRTLEAFANRQYPFEDLVDNVAKDRDPGRHPICDVGFTFENSQTAPLQEYLPYPEAENKLNIEAYPSERKISIQDFTLGGYESGDQFVFRTSYCTRLFKKETMVGLMDSFKEIVNDVAHNPEKKLADVGLISQDETFEIITGIKKAREGIYAEFTI